MPPTEANLSYLARTLLQRAARAGGIYLCGAGQLSAARSLVRRGLGRLEDNGGGGLRDGQRWWFTPA